MRYGWLVLLAVLFASPAMGQSDTRRVAIWNLQGLGTNGGSSDQTSGVRSSTGHGLVSSTNYVVKLALTRMGVPFTEFNVQDSTGGWAATMRQTRGAGVADSTWFRQQGYFLHIMTFQTALSGAAYYRFFTDAGTNRGVFTGSPLDGNFGITLAFVNGAVNTSDSGYVNGIESIRLPANAAANVRQAFHDNGDSTSWNPASDFSSNFYYYNLEPSQSADVTRLIDADSIKAATLGNAVIGWKYKKVIYMPVVQVLNAQQVIYGLSQAFTDAGYRPRRKLNVHWTLDHVYPNSTKDAVTDSFFVYVKAMDLKFSAMYTGGFLSTSTGNGAGQSNANNVFQAARWDAFKDRLYGMPHSHRTNVGLESGAVYDYTAYTDTATITGYFNMMERAISDTMKVQPAKGYYKTIGLPNNWIHYPHLYMLTQNGYTDMRAAESDSTGHRQNLHWGRAVNSGCASCIYADKLFLPWWYGDPTDATGRRGIWVHEAQTAIGNADSAWSQVTSLISNDINGKNLQWLTTWARAAVWDADIYFHPQDNLAGNASTSNMIMNSPMRRLMYFYNRVKNIVSQEPVYRPKNPAMR